MEYGPVADYGPLANLEELEVLETNGQTFESVPMEISKLKKLRFLSIQANPNLKNLDALNGLGLTHLNLMRSGLEVLPDLSLLKQLSVLGLRSMGQLKDISALSNVVPLDYLDLSFTKFSEVPEGLLDVSARVVDLNSSKFDQTNLGQLKDTEYIVLGFAHPTGEIKGWTYLEDLQALLRVS